MTQAKAATNKQFHFQWITFKLLRRFSPKLCERNDAEALMTTLGRIAQLNNGKLSRQSPSGHRFKSQLSQEFRLGKIDSIRNIIDAVL